MCAPYDSSPPASAKDRGRWQAVFDREIGDSLGKEDGLDDDGIRSLSPHGREGRLDLVKSSDHRRSDFNIGGPTSELDLLQDGLRERIDRVGQDRNAAQRRQHISEQFDAFFPPSQHPYWTNP
jgi:hypothetical protein